MNKFIVTSDGHFRFGDVGLHKQLLKPGEDCIGGGMYEFDYINNAMLLSGRSYDFGRVKWSWIDVLIVPSSLEGLTLKYEGMSLSSFVNIRYE